MSVSTEMVLVQLCKLDCNFLHYISQQHRFALRSSNKTLHDTILPFDITDCKLTLYAVATRNLSLLQWARQKDCPWDAKTIDIAVNNGLIDVLQWLCEYGYPYDTVYVWFEIDTPDNGTLSVMYYNYFNCSKFSAQGSSYTKTEVYLEWRCSAPGDPYVPETYRRKQFAALQWLHENGHVEKRRRVSPYSMYILN